MRRLPCRRKDWLFSMASEKRRPDIEIGDSRLAIGVLETHLPPRHKRVCRSHEIVPRLPQAPFANKQERRTGNLRWNELIKGRVRRLLYWWIEPLKRPTFRTC